MPDTRIQTYLGVFDPLNPDPTALNIEDIAHSLSQQCRFTGYTKWFYSVAQHSCLVAEFCDPAHALTGLLHDASEAYLCDFARPLKHALFGDRYREIEDKLMEAVAERFDIIWPMPEDVKEADDRMLRTEKRDLLFTLDEPQESDLWGQWLTDIEPYNYMIVPMPPSAAETAFLQKFYMLGGKQERRSLAAHQ